LPAGYKLYDTTGFDENEIGKRARLWTVKEKSIYARIVETGVSDGAISEILSGVNQGDVIVTGVLEEEEKNKKKKTSPFMPNVRKPANSKK
ncbi:MAG: hypothetical protein ACHQF2_02525, partial [Flavobacteriales bacterium]